MPPPIKKLKVWINGEWLGVGTSLLFLKFICGYFDVTMGGHVQVTWLMTSSFWQVARKKVLTSAKIIPVRSPKCIFLKRVSKDWKNEGSTISPRLFVQTQWRFPILSDFWWRQQENADVSKQNVVTMLQVIKKLRLDVVLPFCQAVFKMTKNWLF